MIAVIADDLAGASELACAAAAMGFTAEVHTRFDPKSIGNVATESKTSLTKVSFSSSAAVLKPNDVVPELVSD